LGLQHVVCRSGRFGDYLENALYLAKSQLEIDILRPKLCGKLRRLGNP
jgi:hypothetical protein